MGSRFRGKDTILQKKKVSGIQTLFNSLFFEVYSTLKEMGTI